MSIKLTDTQLVMLSVAAQRDDRCLVASQNLRGAVAQKFAAKLIGAGLAKEIKAKPGTPVWRRDEQAGESYALKLTAAGARAIAIDYGSASDETREDSGERVQVPLAKCLVSVRIRSLLQSIGTPSSQIEWLKTRGDGIFGPWTKVQVRTP